MQYKRIMLKLSWEALSGNGKMFDYQKIDILAKKIVDLSKRWMEIAVVSGAGNIRRYRDTVEAGIDRVKSDTLGMTATVMNATILNEMILKNGWEWLVTAPSNFSITPLIKDYNSLTMRNKMKSGKIVFCAWGSGNPYSTTDLWAVLRALELNCEVVIKVTKVDWVYDKDPNKYSDAKKFDKLTLSEANKLNLNIMDHSAIAMASDNWLPIFVCHIDELWNIWTDKINWTLVDTNL